MATNAAGLPEAEHSDGTFSSDESYSPERQNRYGGPESSWREYTEAERALTSSISRLRDQDLALHLYNAHYMKRSNYDENKSDLPKSWVNKKGWLKENPVEDEVNHSWIPPNNWTAWPLSPGKVPRVGEQIGPPDEFDRYTLVRAQCPRPSRELEEILNGIILSLGKKCFEAREYDATNIADPELQVEDVDQKIKADADRWAAKQAEYEFIDGRLVAVHVHDNGRGHTVGNEAEAHSYNDIGDTNPTQAIQEHDQFHNSPNLSNVASVDVVFNNAAPSEQYPALAKLDEDSEMGSTEATKIEQRLQSDQEDSLAALSEGLPITNAPEQRPVVSADEDRSRELLRPTIRNTLSRLDQLLLGLHHARRTCIHYGSESESQASQFEDEAEGSDDHEIQVPETSLDSATKRSRGRPRKSFDLTDPPVSNMADSPNQEQLAGDVVPLKRRVGRPSNVYKQLDGETHQEMAIRIARVRKKPLPFILKALKEGDDGPSSSLPKEKPRRSSRHRSTSQTRLKRRKHLNLRDWSEVIGTAALVGFPPEVISRATQRCATLLGEGMKMHTLMTDSQAETNQDYETRYVPDPVSDLASQSSGDSDSGGIAMSSTYSRGLSRRLPARPDVNGESEDAKDTSISKDGTQFWCPVAHCVRGRQGFRVRRYLRRHLTRAHHFTGEELEHAVQDSDDSEVEDGVHVDGFLKPIKARGGWRGPDSKKRQRPTKTEIQERGRSIKIESGIDGKQSGNDDSYEDESAEL